MNNHVDKIDTNRKDGYSGVSIILHWLIALMITCGFTMGLYMTGLPFSPQKLKIYSWHKWIGVTIFFLMSARLIWRLVNPPSAIPATLKAWERHLAGAVHALLYIFVFLIPVSGWLMSSAAGYGVVYLGMIPIPDLIGKNPELADFFRWLHEFLNGALFIAFLLHTGGVFKHIVIDRDLDVAGRMIPFLRKWTSHAV